ncbi:probable disease resistance protein At4g27220 [Coffea eugenioides]|uniref:probable disease resistance protein At4g27220 n=1 Tax=Coffea eugenioides TaxID=49369 RepID=UPI000F61222E|nr:probable disease resistance protein At4g27220 [Coffea eugenioides]
MCGLKVLNLEGCKGITELPNSVSDMVNLTAFILRDCTCLRSVPPLGKLKQLRDLDLSWTDIEDLPQGWESLVNLESLNLDDCQSLKRKIIPKETFSQFHRLQLLLLPPYVRVQVNDPEVLNQLESFTGCFSFTDFYKFTRWPKYYNNVYINDILTEDPSYEFDDYGDQEKQLYFHQCKLGRGSNYLPDDMERMIIEDCDGMGIKCLSDVFKNFINLNHLSELEIIDLVGIEFLWQLFSASPRDQPENSSFSPLRGLQMLRLTRLPNLLLQNLQNLEELRVEDCEGLEEIAADGNGVGQGGGEGTQLTSSGGAITMISLPNLRCLSLDMLPQLNNICKAAMICDSIEKIEIFGCPKVKRLPLFLPTINGLPSLPSKLRMITGDKERWESEPLLPTGTHSSLKRMCISRCHNMKQLFTMQLLPNLQNLQELDIEDCEGLEEIAADGNAVGQGEGEGTQLNSSGRATTMISLPNLSCLSLDRLPQLNNICKAAMICDSIEEIKIFDCPKVKRLPLFLPTINGLPSLPSTLRKIKGDKEWWESLEWDYPSAKNALDPFLPHSLEVHFFVEDHLLDQNPECISQVIGSHKIATARG